MSSSEACLVVSLVQDFGWTLHQKSGAQTCLETFAPPRFGSTFRSTTMTAVSSQPRPAKKRITSNNAKWSHQRRLSPILPWALVLVQQTYCNKLESRPWRNEHTKLLVLMLPSCILMGQLGAHCRQTVFNLRLGNFNLSFRNSSRSQPAQMRCKACKQATPLHQPMVGHHDPPSKF